MLELGIDEYTMVLQLSPDEEYLLDNMDWGHVAKKMIDVFCMVSGFENVLGKEQPLVKGIPEGYSYAFTYGEHNFYIAVAFHEYRNDMGVVVKFSAQALDYYSEQTGLKPYEILQSIQDDMYTVRLSRVDLTVDYIDEDIDTTDIYNSLMKRKIGVFREYTSPKTDETMYKRVDMKLKGIIREDEVPTIYLGSEKSNSRLRIYDKRLEQIERKGNKYEKAINTNNWVRFEGVFRNEYAHQISEALMNVNDDNEYCNLIACVMIQKYKFMYIDNGVVDCETEFSQMLIDCIKSGNFVLKAKSSRNYDLFRSIYYMFSGSGVMATLFKIKTIWGEDAMMEMLSIIYDYIDEFVPNDDCKYWLRKNQGDYLLNYPDYKDFFKDNVYPIL